MKQTVIAARLRGTPQQYFVGKILNSKGEVIAVHTSKNLGYLRKILQNKAR